MGYTHLELMAAVEHPQPISMGYQITNYFCVNSRMGTLKDFQWFINYLHEQKIGVILDWVPAHFALDKFGLSNFDGSPLFEDDDPRFASHPTWGTKVFDFKKPFTRDFLASNADFILDHLHADGLRVDAVWAMLDLTYDREPGCRTNEKGDKIDLHARAFLQNINTYIRRQYPGAVTIAEETFGYENLTSPTDYKGPNRKRGVGFDMTWHIGWMSDSLSYFSTHMDNRHNLYPLLVKTLSEVDHNRPRGHVVLGLSHDENANAKRTIQGKMPGNTIERFANVRLLLALQTLRGGGPILDFMGNEIAQSQEWHGRLIQSLRDPHERAKTWMQWEELDPSINSVNYQYHRGVQAMRRALNHLFLEHPGLWDQTPEGFQEFKTDDSHNCIIGFRRFGSGKQLACLFNTSIRDLRDYFIALPTRYVDPRFARLQSVTEVFNSDRREFGGLDRLNPHVHVVRDVSSWPTYIKFHLPPLTAVVLEEHLS
jgi:1,4-alpha-glucan branching enzyme